MSIKFLEVSENDIVTLKVKERECGGRKISISISISVHDGRPLIQIHSSPHHKSFIVSEEGEICELPRFSFEALARK